MEYDHAGDLATFGSAVILGGPVLEPFSGPDEWVSKLKARGYAATLCPVDEKAGEAEIKAYSAAAQRAGIVIAEVGAWSNPISRDDRERREAMKLCQGRLALADRIGARCCVNVAGSRSPTSWCGPHPDNYRKEAFDMIVESVRAIIDAVRPTRSFYTLEAMPWAPPDTSDSYVELLRAVDRPRFAVHFDPVNLLWSPQRLYENAGIIKDFVKKLGPQIKSCHAKDLAIADGLSVQMSEVRPGLGLLDYRAYLGALDTLDGGLPLILEHLPGEEEYRAAAAHIRGVASGA